MTKLDDLIQEVRLELGPDFISTDIVNIEEGITIAGGAITPDFDSNEASTRFAMVMKLATKVMLVLVVGIVDVSRVFKISR